MQRSFDFVGEDLVFMLRALAESVGPLEPFVRRDPIWQLVRSLIGAQTYDHVAEQALRGLRAHWPDPSGIAGAAPGTVLQAIREVNHADAKARNLVQTLRLIARERHGHDLAFLGTLPVREALDWLERFPGVGPKVAASTLNASTLRMPVFIVDSHVHRILLRFGIIGPRATAEQGRDTVTAASALDADALLKLFVRTKKLGQTVCRPFVAHCVACPLAARCRRRTALGQPSGGSAGMPPMQSSRALSPAALRLG